MKRSWFLIAVCPLTMAASATAQSFWQPRAGENSVNMEFGVPRFPQHWYFEDRLDWIAYLGLPVVASSKVTVVLEIPWYSYSVPTGFFQSSVRTRLGCPYVGVNVHSRQKPELTGEFGVRLPMSNNKDVDMLYLAELADPERIGAYEADRVLTIIGAGRYVHRTRPNFVFGARIGLAGQFGKNKSGKLLGLYGCRVGFDNFAVMAQIGVSGVAVLTSLDAELPARLNTFGRAQIDFRLGRFEPGLYYSMPFNTNSGQFARYTIGVNFALNFG